MNYKTVDETVINGIAYIELTPQDCPLCTRPNPKILMSYQQWTRLTVGDEHVQNVLPNLTADEREALITGYCPKCWDDIIGVDEDDYAS